MSVFKVGDELWINPEKWVKSTVVQVFPVSGPLGTPTFAYTLKVSNTTRTLYEMTLKNFQLLKSQETAQVNSA